MESWKDPGNYREREKLPSSSLSHWLRSLSSWAGEREDPGAGILSASSQLFCCGRAHLDRPCFCLFIPALSISFQAPSCLQGPRNLTPLQTLCLFSVPSCLVCCDENKCGHEHHRSSWRNYKKLLQCQLQTESCSRTLRLYEFTRGCHIVPRHLVDICVVCIQPHKGLEGAFLSCRNSWAEPWCAGLSRTSRPHCSDSWLVSPCLQLPEQSF